MKITIAPHSGYCFGVKRAVDRALAIADENKSSQRITYTYGPLIHNKQVVEQLESRNVFVTEDLEKVKGGSLIIRSHGVPKEVYERSAELDIDVIDCTCPYVKKIHRIVQEHHEKGYRIIIVGDHTHPEVIGINGWCDYKAEIISTIEEIESLDLSKETCIVAQTTFSIVLWEKMMAALEDGAGKVLIFNTICSATEDRQSSAERLSKEVDAMIVVGGKHSSNTKKLYEICMRYCKKTVHIETKDELVVNNYRNCGKIGICAGASTPDSIVQDIIDKLENEGEVLVNGEQ